MNGRVAKMIRKFGAKHKVSVSKYRHMKRVYTQAPHTAKRKMVQEMREELKR